MNESGSGLDRSDYSNVKNSHDYDHDQQSKNDHRNGCGYGPNAYANGFRNENGHPQNVNDSLLHVTESVNGSASASALCLLEVMSEVNVNASVNAGQRKQAEKLYANVHVLHYHESAHESENVRPVA